MEKIVELSFKRILKDTLYGKVFFSVARNVMLNFNMYTLFYKS